MKLSSVSKFVLELFFIDPFKKIKKQNIRTHKRYIWSEFIDISLIFYTVSLLTKKELIVKRTCKSRMVYLKHVLSLKKVFVDVYA